MAKTMAADGFHKAGTLTDDISLSPSHHEELNDVMHIGQEQSLECPCFQPNNTVTLALVRCGT